MANAFISAKVEGLDELKEKFRNLRANVRIAQAQGLVENANTLKDAIAAAAPVRTGTLQTTVEVIVKQNLTVMVVAGTRATLKIGNGRPYNYARADEFGTVNMAPQPFFFVTYRRLKLTLRRRQKKKVTDAIRLSLS